MPVPVKIAGGRWNVLERIGRGCFAEVHRGLCKETQQSVAIKFEENNRRTSHGQLESEVKRMQELFNNPVAPQGVLETFYYGSDPESMYNFAVLELLGKSLEDHLCSSKGIAFPTFSVKTTVLIAEQGLSRLEYVHSKGLIHRDIKPENFAVGIGNKCHHVYLIDFGLSQTYFDEEHCTMKTQLSLSGNARYASLNSHRGVQQSRRDDLEAFGHMLFQFLLGKLPWTGLSAKSTVEKYNKIYEKKEATPIEDLCKGLPEQFGTYLSMCRNLSFTERPDYSQLRRLFADVRQQIDYETGAPMLDHDFEWLKAHEVVDELETIVGMDCILQPDDDPTSPKVELQVSNQKLVAALKANEREQGKLRSLQDQSFKLLEKQRSLQEEIHRQAELVTAASAAVQLAMEDAASAIIPTCNHSRQVRGYLEQPSGLVPTTAY